MFTNQIFIPVHDPVFVDDHIIAQQHWSYEIEEMQRINRLETYRLLTLFIGSWSVSMIVGVIIYFSINY